ncbi:U1 zinc finger-domain-containing protein [Scleroderma citrinum]
MPKHYCDYCDVFLTHDSASVRKAHNSGRNHLANVRDYYASLGHDKAQNIIDQITAAYESGGGPPPGGFGFGPQHLLNSGPPPPFGGGPPMPFGGPPPGAFGRPPFPPSMPPPGGAPPFPPNGMPPPGVFPGGPPPFPPNGAPPLGGAIPPFPPAGNFVPPSSAPPSQNSPLNTNDAQPSANGGPGGMHPDRLRLLSSGR